MDIYVNDRKIDYKPLFPLSWGNLFQKMLQDENFIPKNHGIVGIIVNDQEAMQVMTEQSDKMVPEDLESLKIFTKDSISISKDGFAKVLTLIESIKAEIASAADLYREGNIKEASGKIVNVMEAFKPMVNFIQSVGISFYLNFDEIAFNEKTNLREKIESFLTTLSELVTAQQKKDYVEIADYLEYQLIEDMTDWSRLVNILIKEVEASARQS
jgi:hypothetical protein